MDPYKALESRKKWAQTEAGRESLRKASAKWTAIHPDRAKARNKARYERIRRNPDLWAKELERQKVKRDARAAGKAKC